MRVLFVSPYLPSPIRVRPFQWIRALSSLGHEVHLVALQPPEDRWLADVPARDCCASVVVYPLSRARTLANTLRATLARVPLQAAYSRHPQAEAAIARLAATCDVVHVEHLRGSILSEAVSSAPRVLDAVDSIAMLFEQAQTQATSWKHRLMARMDLRRTRRFEGGLPDRFDRVVVSSKVDAAAFQQASRADVGTSRIVAIPNGVDDTYFHPAHQAGGPQTILFTGKMSYHANDAAARRLLQRIMPAVWQHEPEARVVLAGKDPSAALRSLATDSRVTVTGYVSDLRPQFRTATVVVAPLVYGVGIQNKVLEALACGVPVVASAPACQGISAVPGRDLLVGSTDEELAAHLVSLLRDAKQRRALATSGRRFVETQHNWNLLARQLVGVYEEAREAHRHERTAPGRRP